MSEEENGQRYRDKLHRHLLTDTPFIPFLGMFLTQVRHTHLTTPTYSLRGLG